MKDFTLKYPLDIQFFAGEEGGQQGDTVANGGSTQGAQSTTQQSTSIDYDKIADVLEKRGAQAQNAALKGYLKEQGVSADEMEQAIKDYKANVEANKQAEANKQQELVNENATLKAKLMNINIDSKIATLAEGISQEKLPFLNKLVDRSGLMNEKGEIDDDKVKEAINNVVKAFPDFKQSQNASGVTKIGSDGNNTNATLDDQLRKNFGL